MREPTTFAAGRDLASRGLPRRGVPSCTPCHGPSHAPRNAYYPLLVGQHYDYLVQQLQLFRDNRRGGSPFSPVMDAAAHRLTPEQIHAVSHYYATLAAMWTDSGFRNATAEPTAAPVFKRGNGNL